MSKLNTNKSTDWHRADIVAALHKAGTSIRKLSKLHGYASPTTLTNALDRPWPKGEQIIADAIGVCRTTIWPSRFENDVNSSKKTPKTSLVLRQITQTEDAA